MSTDFNPEYERRRLQSIAEQHPDLLGDEFCPRQFTQRVTRKDLGNQMLYRDSRMEGWYVFTFYHLFYIVVERLTDDQTQFGATGFSYDRLSLITMLSDTDLMSQFCLPYQASVI